MSLPSLSNPQHHDAVAPDGRAPRVEQLGPWTYVSNTQALAIEDAMGRPCVGLRFLGFNGQTSGIYVLSVDDIEGIIDMLRTQATTARTFDGYTEEAAARIAKREVRCPGCKRVLFGKRKILGTCTECAAVSSEQEVVPGV